MRATAQRAADDFRSGNLNAAAADYREILDKYPDSLFAWSNLGVVLFTHKDYDQAVDAFQHCVAMAPEDAFSLENLGICYYQLGRYDESIVVLEKAITLAPEDAKAWNYLGCSYSEKGRQLDAQHAYKKAIELKSDFGDAYFNLALVLATVKPPDIPGAKENYQRALSLGIAHDPRLEKMLAAQP
jgi:tetratricopeptide (TPR) repeat protein